MSPVLTAFMMASGKQFPDASVPRTISLTVVAGFDEEALMFSELDKAVHLIMLELCVLSAGKVRSDARNSASIPSKSSFIFALLILAFFFPFALFFGILKRLLHFIHFGRAK
jgi:hypothetical protein